MNKNMEARKADIQRRFYPEYFDSTVATRRGPAAAFARWLSKKPGRAEAVAGALGIAAFATLLGGGLGLLPVVAVFSGPALVVAACTAVFVCGQRLRTAAFKAMDKDISNGTLTKRYEDKLVGEKRQKLAAAQSQVQTLSRQLSGLELKPEFASASNDAPPAAPVGKFQLNPQLQHKPV